MKHLWQMLAVGATMAGAGCADSTTRPSPATIAVPTAIVVPAIRGSAAGQFEFNADGSRRYIQDGPGDGSGECYDVCDQNGGGGGGSSGGDSEPMLQGPQFTEAHFGTNSLTGHAEMTFQFADHAAQNMTLSTWRPEGSVIASQKFTTARIWPLPVPLAQTLVTDGTMPAPICGARGQGITTHDVSSAADRLMNSKTETTHSTIMNQAACTSSSTTENRTTAESSSGGVLRICQRLDHYSSTGQYIDTETLYCYYTYAT